MTTIKKKPKLYDSSMFEWYIIDDVLNLKFKHWNWFIYQYPNLEKDILEWFKKAESKWKYFIKHIKDRKDFVKTDKKEFAF